MVVIINPSIIWDRVASILSINDITKKKRKLQIELTLHTPRRTDILFILLHQNPFFKLYMVDKTKKNYMEKISHQDIYNSHFYVQI
jgi:hypothetical protein